MKTFIFGASGFAREVEWLITEINNTSKNTILVSFGYMFLTSSTTCLAPSMLSCSTPKIVEPFLVWIAPSSSPSEETLLVKFDFFFQEMLSEMVRHLHPYQLS